MKWLVAEPIQSTDQVKTARRKGMPGLRFPARALNPVCRRIGDQAGGCLSSSRAPATHEMHDHRNDGRDQEKVNRKPRGVKHRKSKEPGDRKNDCKTDKHLLLPSFSVLGLEAASAHTVPRVSSWFFGIDPGLARRRTGLGSPSLMEHRLSFIEALLREFWVRRVLPPVPIGRLVIVKGST